ncbi:MAG: lipopolysaccharide biosynthesis protein [Actinomycetota bacterium]
MTPSDRDDRPASSRASRLVEALPEGTYAIGAGLLVAGLTAYGFQILAARQLTGTEYAALNGLWVIVFIVAPGFFQPIEQEVSRALAHRRAQGIGGGPLVKRAAFLGGLLAAAVMLIGLAGSPKLIDEVFHDESLLVFALLVGVFSFYLAHTSRGVLSGNGRFGAYGMMHASEGLLRITFCLALFVSDVGTPWLYGLALVLPPLGAIGISLRGQRDLVTPGPEAPYSELSSALGLLLVGSVLAQALSYAPFLGANLLASGSEKDIVGKFITGLFLARIPILLFLAVQAALLPKLAAFASAGRHDDFRIGMRRLVLVVVGLGVIGVIGGGTLGPWGGELLFGEEKFILGRRDLALLAAGSGGFILALTLAQGLIALRAYGAAMVAWMVGILGFVAVTALGDDLFLRVELGSVAGAALASAVMATMLALRMRHGIPSGALEELVDTIGHEPPEI